MNRIPSIHIREDELIQVIESIKGLGNIHKMKSKELVKLITQYSSGSSCNNRTVVISNNKQDKKAKEILKSSKGDAMILSSLIYVVRKKLRHKAIKKIDQDSRDWGKLKELVKCCIEFCNDFNLDKKEGFTIYVQTCLGKISSYRNYVSKMVSMHEGITMEYEAKLQVENDNNPKETRDIFDYYKKLVYDHTGLPLTDASENYVRYSKFINVRETTDQLDIPYQIYIKAQFDGLEWSGNYPEPSQLIGDNAIDRLNKYLYKNKMRKAKSSEKKRKTLKDLGLGKKD